jgi:hypothetical protein
MFKSALNKRTIRVQAKHSKNDGHTDLGIPEEWFPLTRSLVPNIKTLNQNEGNNRSSKIKSHYNRKHELCLAGIDFWEQYRIESEVHFDLNIFTIFYLSMICQGDVVATI